jgi:dienelactone hydrolase
LQKFGRHAAAGVIVEPEISQHRSGHRDIRRWRRQERMMIRLAAGVLAVSVALGATAMASEITGQDQGLRIAMAGRTFTLAARVFHPVGPGPFPLVVINHGTPVSIDDALATKLGFTRAAQWFASQGYMVVVALRPGFGTSDGPYMERSGPCQHRDYVQDGRETAAVEGAIIESAAKLPDVDAHRIVVVGQSAGGFGAIALADAPPVGVVGVISFAGGRGGDDHEHICGGAQRLIDATAVLGKANQMPQLWLVAANDHFFPPALAHAMAAAYREGSKPPVQFVDLPAFDDDGHKTLGQADPSVWAPAVSAFLRTVSKHGPG